MTDLKRFEYVIALAEHLNFSHAAAKLNISQSSLSQYIQKIEKETGVPLFDRNTASLKLTQYGEIYLRGARRIIDIYIETLDSISNVDTGSAGVLRIGLSPSRSHFMLPDVISRFSKLYPNITLKFISNKTKVIMKNLDDGDIDLAYTVSSNIDHLSDYRIYPTAKEEIMLVCAKNSRPDLGASGAQLDLSLLSDSSFVALEDDQLLTADFYELCKKASISPHIAISVSEISTAISIVKSGYGVMLLPSSYRSYGNLDKELDFYSITQSNSHRELSIIVRKEKYLNKPALALIDILSSNC